MKKASEETDDALVHGIVSGNTELFSCLLERYQSYIFAIVSKHVPSSQVEDVAQEASIQLYRSLNTYTSKGNFKSWLSTIAIRSCYTFLRHHYRRKEVMHVDLAEHHYQWLDRLMALKSNDTFDQHIRAQEAKELLDHVLFSLKADDQMILRLIHFEGYTAAETAQMLGWSTANVKIRAFRSKKKLHRLLKKLLLKEQGVVV